MVRMILEAEVIAVCRFLVQKVRVRFKVWVVPCSVLLDGYLIIMLDRWPHLFLVFCELYHVQFESETFTP